MKCVSIEQFGSWKSYVFSGGLENLVALHTLDVSHNQLISCHGLQDVITVQRLNLSHNHIPALDDVKPLGLLQYLDASHNNIMQVSEVIEIANKFQHVEARVELPTNLLSF